MLSKRLAALFRRRRLDAELEEELRFHIEAQVEENVRAGMSPDEARRAALRDFGGVEQVKEAHRDARGVACIETLWRDVRYGARSLVRSPALTLVAVLTLALGIGANTSIFTVLKAVVLAPLPYPEPDRLMRVWPQTPVNTEFLLHYQGTTEAFEALSIHQPASFALAGEGRPEEVSGAFVTPRHFGVMGVEPFLGRGFRDEETLPGRDNVVVLSYGLWQRLFGGDASALGQTVRLSGRECMVAGVMPADYQPIDAESRLWMPLEIDVADEAHWDWITYRLLGRLKPGRTPAQARDDLRRAIQTYGEKRDVYLSDRVETAGVAPFAEHLVSDFRNTFVLLTGGVLLVLLVACVNVANLLLARVTSQRSELALRMALGAGAVRVMCQVLVQSFVLAVAGGAAGVLVAWASLRALVDLLPAEMPRTGDIRLDIGVLAVTLGVAVVSGAIFGVLPAVRAARLDPAATLDTGARGVVGRSHRLAHVLVAAEVALAATLVFGTGLLAKSFHQLQQVDTGFDRDHLFTVELKPPPAAYPEDAQRARYGERVAERVNQLRGVESASIMNLAPMTAADIGVAFRLKERDTTGEMPSVSVRTVTPEFLETLGVPLIRGRPLQPTDRAGTPRVGLINQTMARRLWGDADPVGRQLVFDPDEPWFTVVGVIGDIRQHRLDQATKPQVYLPVAQEPWPKRMALLVRRSPVAPASQAEIEQAIWAVDGNVPISDLTSMETIIARTLKDSRMLTTLFSLFGMVALALGLAGVFGVTSYAVAQRTRENGVRVALGATSGEVVRTALNRTMKPVLAGLAIGCVASLWLARFLDGFLFGVETADPAVLAAVVLLLSGCAVVACYLPARRAAGVDPMQALRAE